MKKLLLLTMAAFCGLGSVGISRAAFAFDDPRRVVAKVESIRSEGDRELDTINRWFPDKTLALREYEKLFGQTLADMVNSSSMAFFGDDFMLVQTAYGDLLDRIATVVSTRYPDINKEDFMRQSSANLRSHLDAWLQERRAGQGQKPAGGGRGRGNQDVPSVVQNACPACTFINKPGAAQCEICGTPLMAGPAAGPAKLPRQAGPAAESDDEDSGYPSAAASRQAGIALTVESIMGTRKPYHLGWLYSPTHNDYVLVNYGQDARPVLNRDGTKNFMYVSPSAPTVALPKGLYYWRGSNQVRIPDQLSDRKVVVMVAANPTNQKKFSFSNGKYENLFKGKKTVWDQAQFQEPTIDDAILRSNR